MIFLKSCNCPDLPEEIAAQVQVIEKSQQYILVIIGAILLSFYSTQIQKQQLICTAVEHPCCRCLPDTFPIKFISDILILAALFFFFHLSKEQVDSCEGETGCCSARLNLTASMLVLLAALIRFFDINFVRCREGR